jgi:hypothetical protein
MPISVDRFHLTLAPPGGQLRCQSRWDSAGRLEIGLDPRVILELTPKGARVGEVRSGDVSGEFERLTDDLVLLRLSAGGEAVVRVGMSGSLSFLSERLEEVALFLRTLTGGDAAMKAVRSADRTPREVGETVATFVDAVRPQTAFDRVSKALRDGLPKTAEDQEKLLVAVDEVLAAYARPLRTDEHLDAPLGGLAGLAAARLEGTALHRPHPLARALALAESAAARPAGRIRWLAGRLSSAEGGDALERAPRLFAALVLLALCGPTPLAIAIPEVLTEEPLFPVERFWLGWLMGSPPAPETQAGGIVITRSEAISLPSMPALTLPDALFFAAAGDIAIARSKLGAKLEAKATARPKRRSRTDPPSPDLVLAQAVLFLSEPGRIDPEVLRASFRGLFDKTSASFHTEQINRSEFERFYEVPLKTLMYHLPFLELVRRSLDDRPPAALVNDWLWPRPSHVGALIGPGDADVDDITSRGRPIRATMNSPRALSRLAPTFDPPDTVVEPLRLLRATLSSALRRPE